MLTPEFGEEEDFCAQANPQRTAEYKSLGHWP